MLSPIGFPSGYMHSAPRDPVVLRDRMSLQRHLVPIALHFPDASLIVPCDRLLEEGRPSAVLV